MFNLKDHRGTELEEGQTVAYNYQGQVARGVITEITMGERYRRPNPRIKIEMTHPEQGRKSIVTSEKNLLVINELEE